ncbi:anti-sigma factor family protein [Sedimenticola sp.]|uniref:anti-sigma factor family protein n=1 Tax=Sedimenticola sp. TaxID=1940285 RepID=UPI003D13A182
MNEQPPQITEQEIHAYVDGRLDPTRLSTVEAHLSRSATAREQADSYLQLNRALHSLYDPVLDEPIPPHLDNTARAGRPIWRHTLRVAAMLATLAVGAVGGWFGRGGFDDQQRNLTSLFSNAYTAHVVYAPEVRHPVEVDAEQEQHLVGWLSKRLQAPIRAPVLSDLGYQLLGGRLLPGEESPAAQFMYENPQGDRLTLFIRHNREAGHDTAFRFARQNGIQGFYWIDGELGYALIGEADKQLVSRAAHRVYEQLVLH